MGSPTLLSHRPVNLGWGNPLLGGCAEKQRQESCHLPEPAPLILATLPDIRHTGPCKREGLCSGRRPQSPEQTAAVGLHPGHPAMPMVAKTSAENPRNPRQKQRAAHSRSPFSCSLPDCFVSLHNRFKGLKVDQRAHRCRSRKKHTVTNCREAHESADCSKILACGARSCKSRPWLVFSMLKEWMVSLRGVECPASVACKGSTINDLTKWTPGAL